MNKNQLKSLIIVLMMVQHNQFSGEKLEYKQSKFRSRSVPNISSKASKIVGGLGLSGLALYGASKLFTGSKSEGGDNDGSQQSSNQGSQNGSQQSSNQGSQNGSQQPSNPGSPLKNGSNGSNNPSNTGQPRMNQKTQAEIEAEESKKAYEKRLLQEEAAKMVSKQNLINLGNQISALYDIINPIDKLNPKILHWNGLTIYSNKQINNVTTELYSKHIQIELEGKLLFQLNYFPEYSNILLGDKKIFEKILKKEKNNYDLINLLFPDLINFYNIIKNDERRSFLIHESQLKAENIISTLETKIKELDNMDKKVETDFRDTSLNFEKFDEIMTSLQKNHVKRTIKGDENKEHIFYYFLNGDNYHGIKMEFKKGKDLIHTFSITRNVIDDIQYFDFSFSSKNSDESFFFTTYNNDTAFRMKKGDHSGAKVLNTFTIMQLEKDFKNKIFYQLEEMKIFDSIDNSVKNLFENTLYKILDHRSADNRYLIPGNTENIMYTLINKLFTDLIEQSKKEDFKLEINLQPMTFNVFEDEILKSNREIQKLREYLQISQPKADSSSKK